MKRIALLLITSILLVSCGTKADPEFIQSSDFCLRIRDAVVFNYNPQTCQTAFNREKREFRVHTDNMSDYYCVTLDGIPTSSDQKFKGDIVWTSTNSVLSKNGCTFTVSKIDSQRRVWLWCRKERIGAVVQILD